MSQQLTEDQLKSDPEVRFIDKKRLLARVPLSERTILNMEKKGLFPKRFALTPRKVVWPEHEIDAWMLARQSAGEKIAAPFSEIE